MVFEQRRQVSFVFLVRDLAEKYYVGEGVGDLSGLRIGDVVDDDPLQPELFEGEEEVREKKEEEDDERDDAVLDQGDIPFQTQISDAKTNDEELHNAHVPVHIGVEVLDTNRIFFGLEDAHDQDDSHINDENCGVSFSDHHFIQAGD